MAISQFPVPESGIPTGDTAGRPASPVIGDVYYNGELEIIEIYNGSDWVPTSAVPAMPTVAVVDVGTSVSYGSAEGALTLTPGTLSGSSVDGYIVSTSPGQYSATSTATTFNITVGNNGSYTFVANAYNTYGLSVTSPSTTATLTTIPQAPTIGTATTSAITTDVVVTWTLGSNGGKNLSAITVTPFLDGTTAQTATTAATTASTSATIVGLTEGSAYTFKVKTTNANGDSLESSATGSVTIPTFVEFNLLLIGAGGGGGANGGGGGGGGSVINLASQNLSGTVNVTVGAGGADTSGNDIAGSNGGFSRIGDEGVLTDAIGGGGGGSYAAVALDGGCGGGGLGGSNTGSTAGGTGDPGQNGGTGHSEGSNNQGGGGGGGFTNAGGNAGGSTGGTGGGGTSTYSSTFGSPTSSGEDVEGTYYFAGGGGGGARAGGTGGTGGNGGGGDGAGAAVPVAGSVNTGGGGGGGGNGQASGITSAAGGSGLVIFKTSGSYTATGTTGSPTRVETGGNTYYTFTGNGSLTV
jgi:hypothetical protein